MHGGPRPVSISSYRAPLELTSRPGTSACVRARGAPDFSLFFSLLLSFSLCLRSSVRQPVFFSFRPIYLSIFLSFPPFLFPFPRTIPSLSSRSRTSLPPYAFLARFLSFYHPRRRRHHPPPFPPLFPPPNNQPPPFLFSISLPAVPLFSLPPPPFPASIPLEEIARARERPCDAIVARFAPKCATGLKHTLVPPLVTRVSRVSRSSSASVIPPRPSLSFWDSRTSGSRATSRLV